MDAKSPLRGSLLRAILQHAATHGKSVVARWGPEDFLETRALAVKWETKDDHSIVRTLKSALEAAIVAI